MNIKLSQTNNHWKIYWQNTFAICQSSVGTIKYWFCISVAGDRIRAKTSELGQDMEILTEQSSRNKNSWWRHQVEAFSALRALCVGNSTITDEFSSQRPVTRSFGDFFDLHLNKWLNKQSIPRWFETLSLSLWRRCNVNLQNFFFGYDVRLFPRQTSKEKWVSW